MLLKFARIDGMLVKLKKDLQVCGGRDVMCWLSKKAIRQSRHASMLFPFKPSHMFSIMPVEAAGANVAVTEIFVTTAREVT